MDEQPTELWLLCQRSTVVALSVAANSCPQALTPAYWQLAHDSLRNVLSRSRDPAFVLPALIGILDKADKGSQRAAGLAASGILAMVLEAAPRQHRNTQVEGLGVSGPHFAGLLRRDELQVGGDEVRVNVACTAVHYAGWARGQCLPGCDALAAASGGRHWRAVG